MYDYLDAEMTGDSTRNGYEITHHQNDYAGGYPGYGDTYDSYYYYNDSYDGTPPEYEHKILLYQAFDFERPIYLFLWEILVIFTTIFNVVVMIVLLRKKMRSVIHMVLVAIAISDSMTGLVTLPTYIYTYSQYDEGKMGSLDAYELDKHWCEAFMISKFFLSKWFHNISIWLTLFLGAQRCASVIFPFKTQRLFTMQNTFSFIGIISILSPVLHIYHLIYLKADTQLGFCHWTLENDWALVYLWATLLLMHLIPSILLVVLTALMICRLRSSTSQVSRKESSKSVVDRRHDWNRRMTVIVSTIVIVFLIPEIPYGIFLLCTVIQVHSKEEIMPLNVNRAFHAGYEILLVLSFHANFWIYTVLNKRFRSELKKILREVLNSVCRFIGKPSKKFSTTSTSFSGPRTADSFVTGKSGTMLRKLGGSSTSDSKGERGPLKEQSSETAEKEERV